MLLQPIVGECFPQTGVERETGAFAILHVFTRLS